MGKRKIVPLTDETYAAARNAGRRAKNAPTAVLKASVVRLRDSAPALNLELRNGASVIIPIRMIGELAKKSAQALAKVEIDPLGEGLLWPALDVGISAPGLLEQFVGYATRAKIARAGGSRSTPRKAAAARRNGRKGGRPRRNVA